MSGEAPSLDHTEGDAPEMFSEIECGVCYQTYNAGRRCPRQLRCPHTFCQSCLRAMSRQPLPGAERIIDCPLCRHTTTLTADRSLKSELRVDESVLERVVAAGVLDQEEEDQEESEGEAPETEAGESDSSAGQRGGRLRQSVRKLWRKISGKSDEQRRHECMTNDELRGLALMSCYML